MRTVMLVLLIALCALLIFLVTDTPWPGLSGRRDWRGHEPLGDLGSAVGKTVERAADGISR